MLAHTDVAQKKHIEEQENHIITTGVRPFEFKALKNAGSAQRNQPAQGRNTCNILQQTVVYSLKCHYFSLFPLNGPVQGKSLERA